jgi:hypothetical protein
MSLSEARTLFQSIPETTEEFKGWVEKLQTYSEKIDTANKDEFLGALALHRWSEEWILLMLLVLAQTTLELNARELQNKQP